MDNTLMKYMPIALPDIEEQEIHEVVESLR
jgi:hypothetical protein